MSDEAIFTNGHRVIDFNNRYLCSRCDAVLLTVMQFSSAECPKRRTADTDGVAR